MSENNWSVYMIRCADNSLYTGVSTDVERRFQEHLNGDAKSAKYLKGKGPLSLAFQWHIGSRSEAQKAECQIKKLSKQQKEKIIQDKSLPW